jgi:hypothetical protein
MPNPPKLQPQRGPRGRGIVNLPAEGRKGEPPEWPLDAQTPAEARLWRELWTTPQSAEWARMGSGTRREVARYARLAIAAEDFEAKAATHAQATALADRLGLTPKSMRLLLWQVVADEVAEKRQETSAGARGRIKAVG